MSFGLGLGLGLIRSSDPDAALVASIVQNPNYTASVAGTNVATTRSTGLLCPFTGATLGNNIPCTRRIYLGGKAHDAFGAWPQTVNLFTNSDMGGTAIAAAVGVSLNTVTARGPNGLPTRGFIEDTNTSVHSVLLQAISGLSNSTRYTFSLYLKSTGRRYARISLTIASFSDFSSFCVDLQNATTGYGLCSSLSNGWVRISFQATTSGTVGTPSIRVSGDTDGVPGVDNESYKGDGVSGIDIAGIQIVAGAVPLPLARTNGGTTTVNADLHTMTVSTNQVGAILACAVPIYWSIGAGVAHPSGQIARKFDSDGTDYIGRDTNAISAKQDSGSESASASGLALSASVPMTYYQTFNGSRLTLWRNGSFVAEDITLSGSWAARSSYIIGNTSSLNRAWSGLVLIGVCNGFIPFDDAMAAWHRSVVRALQPLSVPIL